MNLERLVAVLDPVDVHDAGAVEISDLAYDARAASPGGTSR